MYTLYYQANACSLATHTILNMLGLEVAIICRDKVKNYRDINPTNQVPMLRDGSTYYKEGAAILLHLLNKHENTLLAPQGLKREQAIEHLMFANASMHPAYGRLFFAAENLEDDRAKTAFFKSAEQAINQLWQVVETLFTNGCYLGGSQPSPADILLAVYSRWAEYFPINIVIGDKATEMINRVLASEAFKQALARETQDQQQNEC